MCVMVVVVCVVVVRMHTCDGDGGCGVLHVLNVCPRGLF